MDVFDDVASMRLAELCFPLRTGGAISKYDQDSEENGVLSNTCTHGSADGTRNAHPRGATYAKQELTYGFCKLRGATRTPKMPLFRSIRGG